MFALKKGHKMPKVQVLPVSIVTPPSADGTTVIGGTAKAKSTLTLDVGANGSIDGSTKSDKSGHFTFSFHVGFGTTTVEVLGRNKANKPANGTVSVQRIDNVAPALTLGAPSPAAISHTQITVTGRATDAQSGVAQVLVHVDTGADKTLTIDAAGNFSYTTSLPLDGSADGKHVLHFRAVDRAGNSSATSDVTFTLDTKPPATPTFNLDAASDTLPVGDSFTTKDTVTLVGTTEKGAAVSLRGTSIASVADSKAGSFTLTGVSLALGDNPLTVVATDAAGNTSQATVHITRITTATTMTFFSAGTTHVLVGTNENIAFTAGVSGATASTQVQLFTSDSKGTLGTELAPMLDTGDPLIGDSAANDGIYSNTFSLNQSAAGDYYYAAQLVGSTDPVKIVHITAITAPTQDRVQALQTQTQSLSDQLTAAITGGTPSSQALDAVRQQLAAHPELTDPATIEVNSSGISWTSTEGIGSALLLDSIGAGLTRSDPSTPPAQTDIAAGGTHAVHPSAMPMLCGKAKTIAPYAWQFEPADEADEIATALSNAGVTVTSVANVNRADQNVSLDDFKDFSKYSSVAITCHGGRFDKEGVVLNTGVNATLGAEILHLGDLISGRLLVSNSGKFLITPSWVRAYSGKMDHTVVYVGACHSSDGVSMATAFLGNGAEAYYGYTDTVNSPFANRVGQNLFNFLINGGKVGDEPDLYTSDPVAPFATFVLDAPDPTVKLPNPCGVEDVFVSYRWPNTQSDLDTSTSLFGSSVGYACDNNSPYLQWSGDDTSAGGTETVMVHLKQAHDDMKWTDTVTLNLAAGWYIPAMGTGPALLSVALVDPMTGQLKDVEQRNINPGAQSSCASTPVGTVTITLTGNPGQETESFTLS
jgi:hypothetical protein